MWEGTRANGGVPNIFRVGTRAETGIERGLDSVLALAELLVSPFRDSNPEAADEAARLRLLVYDRFFECWFRRRCPKP